jgi:hypothetical protein
MVQPRFRVPLVPVNSWVVLLCEGALLPLEQGVVGVLISPKG